MLGRRWRGTGTKNPGTQCQTDSNLNAPQSVQWFQWFWTILSIVQRQPAFTIQTVSFPSLDQFIIKWLYLFGCFDDLYWITWGWRVKGWINCKIKSPNSLLCTLSIPTTTTAPYQLAIIIPITVILENWNYRGGRGQDVAHFKKLELSAIKNYYLIKCNVWG